MLEAAKFKQWKKKRLEAYYFGLQSPFFALLEQQPAVVFALPSLQEISPDVYVWVCAVLQGLRTTA